MGKKGFRFKNKDKNFAQRRRDKENTWNKDAPHRTPYEDIVRDNAHFIKYYKKQNICPPEEWDAFISALRENLPTAFRITGSKREARPLLSIVQGELFKDLLNPVLNNVDTPSDDDKVENKIPICIPWYPDKLAWQLTLTRKDIRRSEAYFKLHNFLITETNCGTISRQEVVSMLPPLLLDVKPHHKVFDMCAAPGSKTAQLIELLHAEEGKIPTGLVVANEIDNNRCYMLVHQAKRLNSPCVLISNHDATVMPEFIVSNGDEKSVLKFDRILCDVPCSGDGTLRKNPDIWTKWNPANGANLHGVQFRIAKRGVEMLAVGGRLVYSTCSLNPLEDEAVMYRLLVEAEGSLQLVDAAADLPGLKWGRGLSHWVPSSKDLTFFEKYEDVTEKWQTLINPRMFPPPPEDADKYHLDRCIRLLPHHQDTGGFFVAVLEKTAPLPWESSQSNSVRQATNTQVTDSNEDKNSLEPKRKKKKISSYIFKEDPFVFFTNDEPLWPSIRDFFDLSSDLEPSSFLTRCKVGKKKNIYMTSPLVRNVLINNEDRIKVINTGVKTFSRCYNKGAQSDFRLAQEGLHSILPFIGNKRKIHVTKKDMVKLLRYDDPTFPPSFELLEESTRQQLLNIEHGSCVIVYEEKCEDNDPDNIPLSITVVGWRGATSARAYVSREECVHYLRLCKEDVSKYEKNKFFKEDMTGKEISDKPSEEEPIECDGQEQEVKCEGQTENDELLQE